MPHVTLLHHSTGRKGKDERRNGTEATTHDQDWGGEAVSVDCSLSVYKVDSVTDGRGGRLTKEEKTYVQEAAEQAARVERFLAEGRDEWDIKKQVGFVPTSPPSGTGAVWLSVARSSQREVYDDCAKMIPDCKTRLERALEDLDILLVRSPCSPYTTLSPPSNTLAHHSRRDSMIKSRRRTKPQPLARLPRPHTKASLLLPSTAQCSTAQ